MGGVQIQHQDPGALVEGINVAEGIAVHREGFARAEVGVERGEALGIGRGNAAEAVTPVAGRVAVIDVVVAGRHQHGDPGRLHGAQLLDQGLVALHGAVKAQVSGQDQSLRPFRQYILKKGVGDLLHIGHEFTVAAVEHPLIIGAAVGERGGDVVQIAGHHDAAVRRIGSLGPPGKGTEGQQKSQNKTVCRNALHPIPPLQNCFKYTIHNLIAQQRKNKKTLPARMDRE